MIEELLKRYAPISDQVETTELRVILRELEGICQADTYGAVVEFGCYVGTTSLFIRRLLNRIDPTREFHVYDSFAGLPAKASQDASPAGEHYRAGELAASRDQFVNNFKKAGLAVPVIHKSWFEDLTTEDIPAAIAFAFIDGDFYQSTKTPLRLIHPRLSLGAKIIVDDYQSEALPGVRAKSRRRIRSATPDSPARRGQPGRFRLTKCAKM
jgi:O-methyltransferase